MISEPTVFVLGAGASFDYGFPLGEQLRKRILEQTKWFDAGRQITIKDPLSGLTFQTHRNGNIGLLRLMAAKFDPDLITEFQKDLINLGGRSIDKIIGVREGKYEEIGKFAITCELLQSEQAAVNILAKRDTQKWYDHLWDELMEHPTKFRQNTIRVITFNYDCSLEFYLLNRLTHLTGNPEEARELLSNIPIVHVHGHLGLPVALGGKNESNRVFGKLPITLDEIKKISRSLTFVHEPGSDELFERAFNFLFQSKRIYFIGFGFHRENIRKLRFSKVIERGKGVIFRGSCYNMNEALAEELVHEYLYKKADVPEVVVNKLELYDKDCANFWKDCVRLR